MVRSYELGVLLVPSLEAAYRSSRWVGFSCTSDVPPPAAAAGTAAAAAGGGASSSAGPAAAAPAVRFVAWKQGMSQEAQAAAEGEQLRVPLPVPYSLPPKRYAASDQAWAWDGKWRGMDSMGLTIGNKQVMPLSLLRCHAAVPVPGGFPGTAAAAVHEPHTIAAAHGADRIAFPATCLTQGAHYGLLESMEWGDLFGGGNS